MTTLPHEGLYVGLGLSPTESKFDLKHFRTYILHCWFHLLIQLASFSRMDPSKAILQRLIEDILNRENSLPPDVREKIEQMGNQQKKRKEKRPDPVQYLETARKNLNKLNAQLGRDQLISPPNNSKQNEATKT